VFYYYHVLSGRYNHHRWKNGRIEHVINTRNNFSAYPADEWDSHPSSAGQVKATAEFVPLLNYYYNRFAEEDNL
ncbi:MAG: hypothetical protein ACE5DO_10815, partial [Desulfobacterales bacterium]